MTRRSLRRLEQIRRLDPVTQYRQIYYILARVEFRLEHRLGMLLAFWRAHAVPSIAELLERTGETTQRAGKRADDSGILMYELVDHGLEQGRGRQALRRLNQIHRGYNGITNDEYLHVLGSMIFIPERLIDRYGWRDLCCHERTANYVYNRELGRRMNIRDIPSSRAEFEDWYNTFEYEHMGYSDAGARLMAATRAIMYGRIKPRPVAAAVHALTPALLDPAMRRATGTPDPSRLAVAALNATMAIRRLVLGLSARPERPHRGDRPLRTATYPRGYRIDEIGPQVTHARQ